MKIIKYVISFTLLLIFISNAHSDEGMWMPHQMMMLDLEKQGLEMDPSQLYQDDGTGLMSAVVHLGGGTGEFVSTEGLILTNHHVAFGALQRASDKEHDYIQKGYLAHTREKEIPAPGYIADVLLGYEEITDKIQEVEKTDMTYGERYQAVDKIQKEIIQEAEKQGPDIRCRIASMYSGNKYYLFTFKRIKDIRLVYAPPRDLGNFGGDIDNWMWPRHTCDFSFLRAYVSPENVGVDYSSDNVPYHPKSIITISLEGVAPDDFTFVMGYPGRTYRNYTVSELLADIGRMQESIKVRKELIQFFEKAGKGGKEIEIKYASKIKGLNNGLKNYQGKLEGFEKVNLVGKKKDWQNDIRQWIRQDSERQKQYGECVKKIDEFMQRYSAFNQKQHYLDQLTSSYYGPALLSQAYLIARTVTERQKPDMEREPFYQERNLDQLKQRLTLAERGYDLRVDRAFFKDQLKRYLDLSPELIPEALKDLIQMQSEPAIDEFVDNLYDNTQLADPEQRLEMINMNPEQLYEMNDPFINLARKVEEELNDMREKGKAWDKEHQELKKIFLQALLVKNQKQIAPDANSTIRFTCGTVKGYSPRDAVYYKPLTSLTGVMEKDTGEFPFRVPEKLKTLYEKKDFGKYVDTNLNDVPACFLNT
ncbi:MAG: S46 family peptidase, partial [bacterium]